MAATTKTCTKCKCARPLCEFNKLKRSKDGLQYHCNACRSAWYKSKKAAASIQDVLGAATFKQLPDVVTKIYQQHGTSTAVTGEIVETLMNFDLSDRKRARVWGILSDAKSAAETPVAAPAAPDVVDDAPVVTKSKLFVNYECDEVLGDVDLWGGWQDTVNANMRYAQLQRYSMHLKVGEFVGMYDGLPMPVQYCDKTLEKALLGREKIGTAELFINHNQDCSVLHFRAHIFKDDKPDRLAPLLLREVNNMFFQVDVKYEACDDYDMNRCFVLYELLPEL